MDSVVVIATRHGFDINAFIKRVEEDTTFHKAFKSMRVVSYSAVNNIQVYDKNGKVEASLYSKTKQFADKGCRSMKVLEEKTTGDFYTRKHDYNYYTAGLYAYLFFTKGTVCHQTDVVAHSMDERESGQMGKSKYELEQLIFNPGSKISGIFQHRAKGAILKPVLHDVEPAATAVIESSAFASTSS